MKKILALLLSICACISFAACAKEETPKEEVDYTMTFVNQTNQDVTQLCLRPLEDYEWTDNLLQESKWENGFEVPVSLSGTVPVTETGWQIKMVFSNNTEQIWKDVALEDGAVLTFTLDDGTPVVVNSTADTTKDTAKTNGTTLDDTTDSTNSTDSLDSLDSTDSTNSTNSTETE